VSIYTKRGRNARRITVCVECRPPLTRRLSISKRELDVGDSNAGAKARPNAKGVTVVDYRPSRGEGCRSPEESVTSVSRARERRQERTQKSDGWRPPTFWGRRLSISGGERDVGESSVKTKQNALFPTTFTMLFPTPV
jgi:hypothetical protein